MRLELTEYKKKNYVMVREQYKKDEDDEEWAFGKGCNIPVTAFTSESASKCANFFTKLADKLAEKEDEGNDAEDSDDD